MTDKENIQLEFIKAELLVLQARVLKRQTSILSGFYKRRVVTTVTGKLNEAELLVDEMNTLDRHINKMQELAESIYDFDKE